VRNPYAFGGIITSRQSRSGLSFEAAFPPHPVRHMHETLRLTWGCQSGEIFFLEQFCGFGGAARPGGSLFTSSAALNKLGGVASPPDALAIL